MLVLLPDLDSGKLKNGKRDAFATTDTRRIKVNSCNQPIAVIPIRHAIPIASSPRVAQPDSPALTEAGKQLPQNPPPKPLDSPPVTCLAPRVTAKAVPPP